MALTSPTSGNRSVGIVRLRITAREFSFFFVLFFMFENKVLKRIFGHMNQKVTGGWR
jgi:hypothetical protein